MSKQNGTTIKTKLWHEHVRDRMGVYLTTELSLYLIALAKEVFQNSLDESNEGYGDVLDIEISNDSFYVKDYGRGLPHEKLTDAVSKMNTSGKYDANGYSSGGTIGTNGMGLKIVNAVSNILTVESVVNGVKATQTFTKGVPTTELIKTKTNDKNGTTVFFKPDLKLFKDIDGFDFDEFDSLININSYLFKNVTFNVTYISIDGTKNKKVYRKENGLLDLYNDTNNKPLYKNPLIINGNSSDINIECYIGFNKDTDIEHINSFANNVQTIEDGTHVTGLKLSVTNTIKKYIQENNLVQKKDEKVNFEPEDYRAGLECIISIKMDNNKIIFQGQSKQKLGNTEVQGAVQTVVNESLYTWLKDNKELSKLIYNNVLISAKARMASKRSKELVIKKGENKLSIMSDLNKYKACSTKDLSLNELILVEGDSGAGGVINGRNKLFQAIYALKGKPLNAVNSNKHGILSNKELSDFNYIITGKKDCLGDKFNIDEMTFGKVILLADADIDG